MAEYGDSRFSAKTYNLVADTIREQLESCEIAEVMTLATFARRLAFKFSMDNPNFKGRKFIEACGLEWKQ